MIFRSYHPALRAVNLLRSCVAVSSQVAVTRFGKENGPLELGKGEPTPLVIMFGETVSFTCPK